MGKASDHALAELTEFGLAYPEAHLKSPWPEHADLAVRAKTFAYLPVLGRPFQISCKLSESAEEALLLPFCSPTDYGLGKWGWITAAIPTGKIPLGLYNPPCSRGRSGAHPNRAEAASDRGLQPLPASLAASPDARRDYRPASARVRPSFLASTRFARTPGPSS